MSHKTITIENESKTINLFCTIEQSAKHGEPESVRYTIALPYNNGQIVVAVTESELSDLQSLISEILQHVNKRDW